MSEENQEEILKRLKTVEGKLNWIMARLRLISVKLGVGIENE